LAIRTKQEERQHKLKRQLAEGPRSARVAAVDESDKPVNKRYNRFIIEGGW
jgi:hypothetical protein